MSTTIEKPWQLSSLAVAQKLQTDCREGLSEKEAKERLRKHGPNTLVLYEPESLFSLLMRQFVSPLVWVLAVAGILAFSFQEWLEGMAILAVILINALIGFFMERQAVRSMEALRKLTRVNSNVIRQGNLLKIKAPELVPGDLLFLEAGDVVPADCRVVEQSNLAVKEAALTGESIPVRKQIESLKGEVVLADRVNLLFNGTIITRGNAKAIITATGKSTEFGKISQLAHKALKSATPLEKKLKVLSQKLLWLTFFLVLLILIIGVFKERDIYLMIKTAIALGIAAIPEGLPIVATIALARGMLRLARNRVVVKKLSTVETLGETGIIFTDKTGTLTENQLSADTLEFEFGTADVFIRDSKLEFETPGDESLLSSFAFDQMRKVGVLCNNAALSNNHEMEEDVGDPLEVALLEFAESSNANVKNLRKAFPRIREIPFDSDTKMMGSLHNNGKRPDYLVCIKGALEVVLKESDFVLTQKGKKPLKDHNKWIEKANELASKGLRVLAFAYSEIDEPEEQFFHNLIFIGFIGFLDPPREDVPHAILTCKNAGIKVIMVTGDHPGTAKNIALKTGLVDNENDEVIHGKELRQQEVLGKTEIEKILNTTVFARVSPAQKLELISVYQNNNYTVGMTGDGVNDTPALKKADIGIAMGKRGTEAAKEVADLVLEDDAFTSIVLAIKQGRGIFQNIRYFVVYLLSCNLSEILVVASAAIANLATPLLPLQILFLNMVTDVFPALALGMNKEADTVMQNPPRNSREPIINKAMWKSIIVYSLGITLSVIGVLLYSVYFLKTSSSMTNNLTFYTLTLAQLWHVFNLPAAGRSFFNNEITRNMHVWLALVTCIIITVLAYSIPITREVLYLQPISWEMLWVVVPFSLVPLVFVQVLKRIGVIG